jgi:phospholipid/cholesterol/gamma-HCH transport system ATP-binding protein
MTDRPMIEIHDLTVSVGGQRILGPLEGRFGQGTLVLVGPAQAGKTTLLKALCGLAPGAISGSVMVDGQDLTRAGPEELAEIRSGIGLVFQGDALFDSLDAISNVALPLLKRGMARPAAIEQARQALDQVGLAGQERVLPERLSGGMRKRLGLARAVAARPRYLLADDPLAGLDPGTTERVLELLLGLCEGRGGLIIAAADPGPLWNRADEVLVLDRGRQVVWGPAGLVRSRQDVGFLIGEEAGA